MLCLSRVVGVSLGVVRGSLGVVGSRLRSNFNSRGVNSREIGRFLGHNSEPVRS